MIFSPFIFCHRYNVSIVKLTYDNGGIFVPLIIEVVSLYFAISFLIDAYSELKIWQFKTLVRNSDDEDPLRFIDRETEEIERKGKEISDRYEKLISKVRDERDEVKLADELPENTEDIDVLRKQNAAIDVSVNKQRELSKLINIYFSQKEFKILRSFNENILISNK